MVSCFLRFPFLRIALTIVYLVLLIISCAALASDIFSSPLINIDGISGTHLYAFEAGLNIDLLGSIQLTSDPDFDVRIYGANATLRATVAVWQLRIELNITMPYETGFQMIDEKFNYEDVPCKEFTKDMKSLELLGLLTVFTGFMQLALVISNFFSRMLLPVTWVMAWICVGVCSGASGVMMRRLTSAACYGTPEALPAMKDFAFPVGGFGLYLICMIGYLVTAVMTAFL